MGDAHDHIHPEPTTFFGKYVFSIDHKVIGIQYGVTLVTVLLIGGLSAMLMRIELASAGQGILDLDDFNKVV